MDFVQDFIKETKQISSYNTFQVFQDFVKLSAISLYNVIANNNQLEAEYADILGKYKDNEKLIFPNLLGILTLAFEVEINDYLGEIYHNLKINDKSFAQFFTPFHIAKTMALMTFNKEGVNNIINDNGYLSFCEPTCGSGCLALGAVKVLKDLEVNFQEKTLFVLTDLDEQCFYMSYIQLSLLGVPAKINHGNTLTNEFLKSWGTMFYYINAKKFNDEPAKQIILNKGQLSFDF